jgi:threonine/homoserine/homoserine lactone efflux protein
MATSSLQALFVTSFLLGIGAVVSPGPVSAAIVSQSPRRGWIVGPLIATGHSFMELAIVALIGIGLTSFMTQMSIQTLIAILGGLLLIWMGGSMLNGIWKGKIHLTSVDTDESEMSYPQMIGLGMITTLSNPFWYAWWVTVAAGLLVQAQALGSASLAAFFFGHISADYLWDTILSVVIGSGRQWITDTTYRWIIGLCGAFFLYMGFQFIINGFTMILAPP